MFVFNGSTKIIQIDLGNHAFDMVDLYSSWKLWLKDADNAKYAHAFEAVGGQTITGDNIITPYFYLVNGWKISPAQENHTLVINGNLLTLDGTDPFVNVVGNYQIRVQSIVAVRSETIATKAALTDDEMNVIADKVWSKSINDPYPVGTFGHWVSKRLLTITKFLNLNSN